MVLITLIWELSLLPPLAYPDSCYFENRYKNSPPAESLPSMCRSMGLPPEPLCKDAQLFICPWVECTMLSPQDVVALRHLAGQDPDLLKLQSVGCQTRTARKPVTATTSFIPVIRACLSSPGRAPQTQVAA